MIGTHIFNYKITRLIGAGGMAKVYEAIHDKFENRRVAIKILDPVLSANEEIRHRFENEAKIMASLDHPNIVKVLDYTEASSVLAIVMEYLEGVTLSDYVKKNGPMPTAEASKLMCTILEAFEFAHKHGVVHRDVKPSNIHLSNTMQPKIMDFGIAKLLTVDDNLTRTGTQMGTPTYMSPEQVRDVKDIDKRSDIYSLGVTFYFMLSGAAPYNTATLSTFDIYNKIVHEPLPPISHALAFSNVVAKATAKNPADRYPNCLAMVADLQQPNEVGKPTELNDDDEKTLIATDTIKKPEPLPQPTKKQAPPKAESTKSTQDKTKPPTSTTEKAQAENKPKKSIKRYLVIGIAAVLFGGLGYGAYNFGLIPVGKPSLSNCPDSLSYAKGIIQGVYLKGKFDTINMAGLKRGIMNASNTDVADMPDPQLMEKYLRNNFIQSKWDEEESARLFEAYGKFIYCQSNQDMIYEVDNNLFYKALKDVITSKDAIMPFAKAIEYVNGFDGSQKGMENFKRKMAEKAYFSQLAQNTNLKKTKREVYYELLQTTQEFLVRTDKPVYLVYTIKGSDNTLIASEAGNYYQFESLMPGMQEVINQMRLGEKVRAYIPSALAYGFIGLDSYNIKPYTPLVCELETPDR